MEVGHIPDTPPIVPQLELPPGTDTLKSAIAWGNSSSVVDFFSGLPETARATFAPELLSEREQFWPLIADRLGEPDHHRIRAAWRAGLAAIFASATLQEITEFTQVEHAYDEAFGPPIVAVLDDRRPPWLTEWIERSCARYPSGRLISATAALGGSAAGHGLQIDPYIDGLVEAAANDPLPQDDWIPALLTTVERGQLSGQALADASEHTLRSSPSEASRLWLGQLLSKLHGPVPSLDPAESLAAAPQATAEPERQRGTDTDVDAAMATPFRAKRGVQELRPLTPADRLLERRLGDTYAPQSWHWQLARALFETRLRHDHDAAATHFERARQASDDHPEVVCESAFFNDHVIRDKLTAEREYEMALKSSLDAPYELYTAELASLLGRPYFDSSAVLAKHAGFLARERDDMTVADTYLARALFVRRRLGANAAAIDPDHIAFLRQLARVAAGDAGQGSLLGFDEWSGPSQITLELSPQ